MNVRKLIYKHFLVPGATVGSELITLRSRSNARPLETINLRLLKNQLLYFREVVSRLIRFNPSWPESESFGKKTFSRLENFVSLVDVLQLKVSLFLCIRDIADDLNRLHSNHIRGSNPTSWSLLHTHSFQKNKKQSNEITFKYFSSFESSCYNT